MNSNQKKKAAEFFGTAFKGVVYPFLVVPVLVAAVSVWIVVSNMPEDYSDWWFAQKAVLESMALYMTGGAFAVSLLGVFKKRAGFFSIWLSGFSLTIWLREIHWDWMSTGVYVGLAILFSVAYWKYEKVKPFFQNRLFLTLMAVIIFSYFVAVTLDQQWWTEGRRMDKAGKLAGEVVENLGHMTVLILIGFSVFCQRVLKNPEVQ